MTDLHIFENIAVVMTVAAAVALVMRVLKQPMIVAHIVTGIIVGGSVLGVLENETVFEALSEIGIVLLLFIIGLGLRFSEIKEVGRVAIVGGIVQMTLTAFLGTSLLIFATDFSTQSALLGGIALGFSSTIIILKMLSDKKEQNRLYGKIAIGLLLMQDLAATIGLIYLSAGDGDGLSVQGVGMIVVKTVLLVALVLFISRKLLGTVKQLIAGSQEFLFLFAIGWCFSLAILFEYVGLSVEVGALFAGLALSPLPYSSQIAARLKPLRDFFIIIFYILLGSSLNLGGLGNIILPVLLVAAFVVLVKPLIVLVILGLHSYAKKVSFMTASTMGQVSEFSLIFLLLVVNQGLAEQGLLDFMTLVALTTVTISAYMMQYSELIFEKVESQLTLFERRKPSSEGHVKKTYTALIFGYEKGGQEFVKAFKARKDHYTVIDYDPQVIDELEHNHIPFLYGDATDPELLAEIDLTKTKIAVATITDHKTNKYILSRILRDNPKITFIGHSDSQQDADELYELGATYVMIPHRVGSERVSNVIRRKGFARSNFKGIKRSRTSKK